ncbi:hypothetical protein BCE75_110153 [Isoptericola sp. CG 20/1183]|uniref:LemA family protein n=1 Tax=Isoptericola halotolerans TaxID=300560 RepID=A0ABX5EAY9_9MICO|nr:MULTISPECIES: hypothetical protein [Isoptericola]PRZ04367.1 hypothetical protein BCL65_11028 [Isoptericola halotolerans]PRZ04735.1 hypothetical protein BCE75_110153 [Isoptericola sp. CG 20/1183]
MSWSEAALLAVVVLGLALWFVWVSASRLDRLHHKVVASRLALQAQLDRRVRTSLDLAASGLLDPASSVLVADASFAVTETAERTAPARPDEPSSSEAFALTGLPADREGAESELSVTLRSVLDDPETVAGLRASAPGAELVGDLGAAWYRAQLARRFHNEAVAQAQRARRPRRVRWLRLAGRAPWPQTVELDDQMPDGIDLS